MVVEMMILIVIAMLMLLPMVMVIATAIAIVAMKNIVSAMRIVMTLLMIAWQRSSV